MNWIKHYWRNLHLDLSEVQEQFSSNPLISADSPILLDVAQYSENSGDAIIMYYVNKVFNQLYPNSHLQHLPTHRHTTGVEHADKTVIKFVCGTNILTSDMNHHCPLALPRVTLNAYRNSLCLTRYRYEGNQPRDQRIRQVHETAPPLSLKLLLLSFCKRRKHKTAPQSNRDYQCFKYILRYYVEPDSGFLRNNTKG